MNKLVGDVRRAETGKGESGEGGEEERLQRRSVGHSLFITPPTTSIYRWGGEQEGGGNEDGQAGWGTYK